MLVFTKTQVCEWFHFSPQLWLNQCDLNIRDSRSPKTLELSLFMDYWVHPCLSRMDADRGRIDQSGGLCVSPLCVDLSVPQSRLYPSLNRCLKSDCIIAVLQVKASRQVGIKAIRLMINLLFGTALDFAGRMELTKLASDHGA